MVGILHGNLAKLQNCQNWGSALAQKWKEPKKQVTSISLKRLFSPTYLHTIYTIQTTGAAQGLLVCLSTLTIRHHNVNYGQSQCHQVHKGTLCINAVLPNIDQMYIRPGFAEVSSEVHAL